MCVWTEGGSRRHTERPHWRFWVHRRPEGSTQHLGFSGDCALLDTDLMWFLESLSQPALQLQLAPAPPSVSSSFLLPCSTFSSFSSFLDSYFAMLSSSCGIATSITAAFLGRLLNTVFREDLTCVFRRERGEKKSQTIPAVATTTPNQNRLSPSITVKQSCFRFTNDFSKYLGHKVHCRERQTKPRNVHLKKKKKDHFSIC